MEMKKTMLPFFNLQFFAEGGTGDGGESGVSAGASLPATGVRPESGVQIAQAQTSPQIDRAAKFDELIKGEYKDIYNQRVSDTVQKRLKNSKETVDRYNALAPTLEVLARKYGISDVNDIESLNKAIEEDDSYYEDEALERGISVKDLKEIRRMERENAQLKEQMRQQKIASDRDRIYSEWMQQSEELKSVYPSFDLNTELTDKTFVDLLRAGVDVKTAFEVRHKDEIIPAAMQYTAKKTAEKLTNAVMSNAGRPRENGTSSASASIIKSDVSKLTKQQRQEIALRVARGERITFS